MNPEQIRHTLARIEREYLELPGLSLTESQVCRLWGLPPELCAAVLGELVRHQFLIETPRGTFQRRTTHQ